MNHRWDTKRDLQRYEVSFLSFFSETAFAACERSCWEVCYVKLTLEIPDSIGAELEAEAARTGLKVRDLATYRICQFGLFLRTDLLQMPLNANTSQNEGCEPLINSGVMSLREQIQLVDMQPSGGMKTNKNSPFQRRRMRQVSLLQQAWRDLFPNDGDVLDKNLKKWLVVAGDNAEEVLDAFEVASVREITGPGLVSYITKVVSDKPQPKQIEQAGGATNPYGGYITPDSWKIRPMTEAEKREQEEVERWAIERGLWNPETDREPRE